MSIFGDLDVDEIGDDPFATANGTYWAVCTDARISEKDGNHSLIFSWSIDEPDSEFHGNRISEFYNLYPGKKNSDLDADQLRSQKFLKRRMRQGFGFSEEEMKALDADALIGKCAYITVKNNPSKDGSGRVFTNVLEAMTKELYDEKNQTGDLAQGASSLGL